MNSHLAYSQRTGRFELDGKLLQVGYAGSGPGKNNPSMQGVRNVGPIPRGVWHIVKLIEGPTDHGPYVLVLEADPKTRTYNRSGFLIHGDSKSHPGEASKGCIILSRASRERVWKSGHRVLEVVA